MRLFAGLMMLASCWRGGGDTTPEPTTTDDARQTAPRVPGASCDEVATNVRLLIDASTEDNLKPRAGQIAEIVERRCSEDDWSMELKRCLAGAKTLDDTDGCEKLATKEQQDKLEHDVQLEENAN